jgi:haloacetate dehalogenase
MFKRYTLSHVSTSGAQIAVRHGGEGPALVLLHGHPQTHVMWHLVADELARDFSVFAMDLRGYGASSRLPADPEHVHHSKRAMAQDVVEVLRHFGHERFAVLAHDRGARVAHRLAADHPGCVQKLMLLDIAPTLAMYEGTTQDFAQAYWHWFFLTQAAPLPERLIEADPGLYVRQVMGRRHAGLSVFAPLALAAYEEALQRPGSATSLCEDYRASAGIDLAHDREDRAAGRRLTMPLRVLWGRHGTVGRCFDVLRLWRDVAEQVDGRALDCGHYLAEERPDEVLQDALGFFKETP